MPSTWFFGLLAAACLMGSGCSSVRGRGESRFYPGPFPGLAYHQAEYVDGTGSEQSEPSHEEVEHRMLGLIDFPFSFALDTALLPWDVVYWALKKDSK